MAHRTSGLLAILALIGLTSISGCASSGGGAVEDMGQGTIEMQFWNRSDQTMALFARWGNAPRVRLGRISGGRRATYQTAIQGPIVAISWDVLSATPPPGTLSRQGQDFAPVADAPTDPQCGVNVEAGDRVEWTIASNAQSCSYVRLDPAE